jgi:hypothetical protein
MAVGRKEVLAMTDLMWWDYSDLKANVTAAIADAQAALADDTEMREALEIALLEGDGGIDVCPSCGGGSLRSKCEVCHMTGYIFLRSIQ